MKKNIWNRVKRCAYSTLLIGAISVSSLGQSAPLLGENISVVEAAQKESSELAPFVHSAAQNNDSNKTNDSMLQKSVSISDKYVTSDNWLQPLAVTEGEACEEYEGLQQLGASLPSQYDPRNVNGAVKVTPVRDQGSNETCWAFATVAAMESNLIKKGYADASINLSENQFAYFFYNRKTDPLGYTAGDYNFAMKPWNQNGGTLYGAGLAVSTWAGMTYESVSPYLSTPADNLCYRHEYSARSVVFLDYNIKSLSTSVSRIKEAVSKYGAVATGMYMDWESYLSSNGAYYCNKKGGNHAVTIVGWDDNYSRRKFGSVKPSRDGAWIVKNSYGTSIGDAGYLYISYEDASLSEMMAVDTVPLEKQYNNNYQYDGSANPTKSLNLPSGAKYANVFKAKASSSYEEKLKAVSICTYTPNVEYEIQVYTDLSKTSNPASGKKAFSSTVKGRFSEKGYQTVDLPKAITLVPGEYFSVVVTVKNSQTAPAMALDTESAADWISFNAQAKKGQSFAYYNKKWYDLSKLTYGYYPMPSNVRIKAYTDTTNKKAGPAKVQGFKISKGSKITAKWKKVPYADGYSVEYAKKKTGKYKKLVAAKKGKTKACKKLKSGTYYVKMRAYRLNGKTKLYGKYTDATKVTVR